MPAQAAEGIHFCLIFFKTVSLEFVSGDSKRLHRTGLAVPLRVSCLRQTDEASNSTQSNVREIQLRTLEGVLSMRF